MIWRRSRVGLLVVLAVVFSAALAPGSAKAGADKPAALSADLDGKPLDLVDVGDWYCHDFAYPQIHCFSDPEELETDVSDTLAVTAVVYVTVYDFTTLQGPYMHISEDYTVLAWIGWNDRISSLRGRNSESGHFYADWFYGGAKWGFCCNQQFSSLGSYDNAFSSVHRN